MTQLIVKYLFIILCLNNIYSQEETLNVQKIKEDIDLLDQKKVENFLKKKKTQSSNNRRC